VSSLGGTMTMESELGKGSTFQVELPSAPDFTPSRCFHRWDGGIFLHSTVEPVLGLALGSSVPR